MNNEFNNFFLLMYIKTSYFIFIEDNEETLAEITMNMLRERGRELPGFVRYHGCEEYIKQLVTKCQPLATELLENANRIVDTTISEIAKEYFQEYQELCTAIIVRIYFYYLPLKKS